MVRLRRSEDLQPLVVLFSAWVYEQRGELVGHIALTVPDPERNRPRWHEALHGAGERVAVMRRLFVAPNSRRKRVGTQLMEAAERVAASHGLQLALDVADHNRGAISFWKKHGWREVGEATVPPGDEGRPLRLLLLVAARSDSAE